jgi:hypothetical protein
MITLANHKTYTPEPPRKELSVKEVKEALRQAIKLDLLKCKGERPVLKPVDYQDLQIHIQEIVDSLNVEVEIHADNTPVTNYYVYRPLLSPIHNNYPANLNNIAQDLLRKINELQSPP